MLGLPIDVAAGVVVAFILFGQALYAVGGDKFLTDLALIATGRYRGGPAKVSVVSSALFGTVSGSAVANVVVDGAITIPLMKRTGFTAHMAAAIEAVASNGGQIMPPVMGAAAFLMAEYLNLPYGQIALAAAIPALLYYLALFTQIDLEAAKHGLAGLPADQIPRFRKIIKSGWVFLIPLGILIYTLMVENWEAGKAGMVAVLAVFGVGTLQRSTRPSFAKITAALEETGKTLLDIAVITALAGIVIGALHLSGFTFKISLLLVTLSGNNVFLLLLITAFGCLFLGLPLPTTVVYITLAVLAAPGAGPIRHSAAGGAFVSFLFRHGLADHAAGLSAGLHCRLYGPGEFLADRLDRDALRDRRLYRTVYFCASSPADPDGQRQGDSHRRGDRGHRHCPPRRRLRRLLVPAAGLEQARASLDRRAAAAAALHESCSASR
jgi:TRAP transporter 4TM/12TM fusion protein